jgi:hypothetical protein
VEMFGPDETNSAMDIKIAARNMSSRPVKYIYYTVKFTNNVGDEIDNSLFGNVLTLVNLLNNLEKTARWKRKIIS